MTTKNLLMTAPASGGGGLSFVSAEVSTGTTDTFALSMPSTVGLATNDMYVAIVGQGDNDAVTADAAWTLLWAVGSDTGRDAQVAVYYRLRDGTEATSYNFTAATPADGWTGVVLVYRGATALIDTTTNAYRATVGASDAAWTGTLATGYSDGDLLLNVAFTNTSVDNSAAVFTAPSGMTDQRVRSNVNLKQWFIVEDAVISGTPTVSNWTSSGSASSSAVYAPIIVIA
jgi:hypothetical protein